MPVERQRRWQQRVRGGRGAGADAGIRRRERAVRGVLQKRNAAGCAAGATGNAGDFYVRVSPKL
jgi:hypothetical protein